MAEVVIFNGKRFYRYPDSPHRTNRVYYTPGIADRKQGVDYLHREIWKAHNGAIPDRHHVHHRDGNPLNNDLPNLVCLSPAEHAAEHWTEERAAASRDHAASIRSLTKAWHRSPEGREWHRQHGQAAWAKREPVRHVCEECGAEFDSIVRRDSNRFCSNACKAAWRRAGGVDDKDRTCAWCEAIFRVNRYARIQTCSRSCGGKLARAQR
ncbi:MAG: HNH endonuclease signature motif containing protein [Thermoleophilaceae bacterium]